MNFHRPENAVPAESRLHLGDEEVERLRRMSPARKLAVMHGLIRQAYALTAAGVRDEHPQLSDDEVHARVRRRIAGDGS